MGLPISRNDDGCGHPYCRQVYDLTWLRVRLCTAHWCDVCELREQGMEPQQIKDKLRLRECSNETS